MKHKYKYKLSKKDIWLSSIYYTIFSINGIFNVLFTIISWIVGIYLLCSGKISLLTNAQKILILFCAILFPIISPIFTWFKVCEREKTNPQKEMTLEINDEGISVTSDNKKGNILWEQMYSVRKRPSMILFMMDTIHGFILPKSIISDKNTFLEVYKYSLDCYKKSKEILKKEGRGPKPLTSDQEFVIEKDKTTIIAKNEEEQSLQDRANLAKNANE